MGGGGKKYKAKEKSKERERSKINEVLYLPNPKTPKSYNKVILDSLPSIKSIKSLSGARSCDTLITDLSTLALMFNLQFLKPSVLFLPCFTSIDFGKDHLYSLIHRFNFLSFSQKQLRQTLKDLPNLAPTKTQEILNFMQEDLL
ncbi:hypothetical protein [Helicobacter sp. UBA3407]|uniref:hypothetical protein n=1 Tax=Helicobacter sp. UBA3407 TaxID=1946588 RepID=UPI00261638B6|nr:hypothetical protein [Helicobacter sp. UBA3407]